MTTAKRGRPKSPDTDPTTGRRGKVLAVQLDDGLRALIEWELGALERLGVTVTRSDVVRAMIVRGARALPESLTQRLKALGHVALVEERERLMSALEETR